jgi:hypothetical protein
MSAMGGGRSAQAKSDAAVKRDAPAAQPAAEGAEH